MHLAGVTSVGLTDFTPALTSAAAGVAGAPIYLGLTPPVGTDGTSFTVDVSGLPSGWTLNGGTQLPNGHWTVTTADLRSLTVTSPDNYIGALALTVTASWTGSDGSALATIINDKVEVGPNVQDPIALSNDAVTQRLGHLRQREPHLCVDAGRGLARLARRCSTSASTSPTTSRPPSTSTLAAMPTVPMAWPLCCRMTHLGRMPSAAMAATTVRSGSRTASALPSTLGKTPMLGDMAADHTDLFKTGVPSAISRISDQIPIGNGNVKDGQWHNVLVSWSATDHTLNYWFDGQLVGQLNQDIVANYLGGSQYAYLGFTAGTGGAHNLQEVHLNSLTGWFEGQLHTITLTATSADLNAATDAQIVGVEAVSAASASAAVTIDLHNQSDGFTITGSAFADTITGSSGADTIVGGSGGDTLTGGAGADTFAYKAIADSHAGAGNFDTIVDFTAGTDQLDLSAISGLTTFKIAGLTSASDAIPAHTIAWFYDAANNQTIVYGNNTASALNGGSAGLFEMHLAGVTSVGLTDFTPALTSAAAGVAGAPIYLGLTPPVGTDGTSFTVEVSGLPSGWTLNGGTQLPNGHWTVTTADLRSLTVTSPDNYIGALALTVTASWTGSDGSALATTINDKVEVFQPNVQDPIALSNDAVTQRLGHLRQREPHLCVDAGCEL